MNRLATRRAVYAIIVIALAGVVLFLYRFALTDALNTASNRGDLQSVKSLMAKGALASGTGMHGMTPLMSAAKGGQTEIVRFLIDKGADVNAHNRSGSVLMWAVASGNKSTVYILLKNGANVQWQNDVGGTALGVAKKYKHPEIAEMLRHAGAT